MLKNIKLPRLPANVAIVSAAGISTITLSIWWNQICSQLETAINGINDALNAASAAQGTADDATSLANGAQTSANNAQTSANTGIANAATAQARADSAYTLAGNAVPKNAGPSFAAATGVADRTTFATYAAPTVSNPPTQAEVQAIANAVQTLSQHMKALIDDLRANGALAS